MSLFSLWSSGPPPFLSLLAVLGFPLPICISLRSHFQQVWPIIDEQRAIELRYASKVTSAVSAAISAESAAFFATSVAKHAACAALEALNTVADSGSSGSGG